MWFKPFSITLEMKKPGLAGKSLSGFFSSSQERGWAKARPHSKAKYSILPAQVHLLLQNPLDVDPVGTHA